MPQRITAAALLLAGIAYFWHFLGRFAYLPGTDAYYYALQAQTLLETGHLKVPDNGLLYYAMAALARLGLPMEGAFRIVLSAVFALVILLLWRLAARLASETRPAREVWPDSETGPRAGIQLVAAVLIAAAAPVLAFHTVEFPRLTLGLALVPLWFHLTAGERPLLAPAPWLVLLGSALLHPLVAALAILFAGITLATAWRAARQAPVSAKAGLLALLAAALCGALLLHWWPGLAMRVASFAPGMPTPGMPTPGMPTPGMPAPGMPGLIALVTDAGLPLDTRATTLGFWMLTAALSLRFVRQGRGRQRYLPLVVLMLALWPNDGSGLMGPGVRLALASLFLALPLTLVMLHERHAEGAAPVRARARWPKHALAALALALALALPYRMAKFDGILMSDDYGQYARVVSALQHRDIPMLIAHRGLDFYYTYRLHRDAFHFDPEPGWKQSDIWRVAARVTPEELAYYAPEGCAWGETAAPIPGTQLLLVREDCWQGFRARISQQDNPDLYSEVWRNMENPAQPRPAFLREKYRHAAQGAFPAATAGDHPAGAE